MRFPLHSALALLACAAAHATAFAPRAAAQRLGVALGAALPAGDYGDAAKAGVVANAFLNLDVPGPLGLRGELFWSRSDIDNPLLRDAGGVTLPDDFADDVSGNVNLIGASANATFALGAGPVSPYLIGGVGVFRRRVAQDVEGTVEEFERLRRNDTEVGFNGGIGLRLSLVLVQAFVEARAYSVATSPDRTTFVPVTVGVVF